LLIFPASAKRIIVPIGASKPAVTKTGVYEKLSTIHPVENVKIIEPIPAPIPPIPDTDPTAD
jgi:hypothetical protein